MQQCELLLHELWLHLTWLPCMHPHQQQIVKHSSFQVISEQKTLCCFVEGSTKTHSYWEDVMHMIVSSYITHLQHMVWSLEIIHCSNQLRLLYHKFWFSLDIRVIWENKRREHITHTVGSQRRTVLSLDPDATTLSNGETATEYTGPCQSSRLSNRSWDYFIITISFLNETS